MLLAHQYSRPQQQIDRAAPIAVARLYSMTSSRHDQISAALRLSLGLHHWQARLAPPGHRFARAVDQMKRSLALSLSCEGAPDWELSYEQFKPKLNCAGLFPAG